MDGGLWVGDYWVEFCGWCVLSSESALGYCLV